MNLITCPSCGWPITYSFCPKCGHTMPGPEYEDIVGGADIYE